MNQFIEVLKMTQISKHQLSKLVYERIFEIFIKSIVGIKDKKEAKDFLKDFLTPTERIMLAKRLSTALLLAKGYDYTTIHKIIHVGSATISSINNILKNESEGYKKVIGRLLREEAIKDFLLEIVEDFSALGTIGGMGSNIWKDIHKRVYKKRKEKPF